eukprot:456924-Prymnesium_polylepis.1
MGRRFENAFVPPTPSPEATRCSIPNEIEPRPVGRACALRLGLPVVLPEWIRECAAAGRVVALREVHMLPALAGVKLRCGGAAISASDGDAIRAAVEAAGGQLVEAAGEPCTHVVRSSRSDS